MAFYLGVDGGGTNTRALLTDSSGTLFLSGTWGPSNFQQIGPDGLREIYRQILEEFAKDSRFDRRLLRFAVLGLAGAGRPEDQRRAEEALRPLLGGEEIRVTSDAEIALWGAFAGKPGIIVIAGTGSICFGMNERGEIFRSGGWGYLLGDEGSGFFLGQRAAIAALRAFDGRGPETSLLNLIVDFLGLGTLHEIIPFLYGSKAAPKEVLASLAPLVFEAASEGDAVAKQIVEEAGKELGIMALSVAKRISKNGQKLEIACIGSVFKQEKWLVPQMYTVLAQDFKDISIHAPLYSPAAGAVLLAMNRAGESPTEGFLQRLRQNDVQ